MSYEIFFIQKSVRTPVKLMDYGRTVCIHWSPDEEFFTVTDYVGSNVSEVKIYNTKDIKTAVEVFDLLPSPVKEHMSDSLNSYLETLRWDNSGLIIRASGMRMSDPKEFSSEMRCNIKDGKWGCEVI